MPSVSACIVAFDESPERVEAAIESLRGQHRDLRVVVCDNHPGAPLAGRLDGGGIPVEVVPAGRNLGFGEGHNLAAARAGGDYLLFLNPDAVAEPECVSTLLAALETDPGAAIAGAQVVLPDDRTVNAGENPIHLTGLSWAGRYGEPREQGPPRATLAVSGAACMVRRSAWEALGGFSEGFFLYHDDVDLCWRARLAGHRVLYCPDAVARHDYELEKGAYKWRWMERNRLWCLAANLEAPTIALLAPLLAATELAIWAFAVRGGWAREKAAGYRDLWRNRRALRERRCRVQATRRVRDADLLGEFSAEIRTPLLPLRGATAIAAALRLYRRLLIAALRLLGGQSADL